jgi:hypothetical protein
MKALVVGVDELVIAIGGMPIALRTGEAGFRELLRNRYAGFLAPGVPAELTFDIELIPSVACSEDLQVSFRDRDCTLKRGDFRAQWNMAERRGHIRQTANPYSSDSVLRVAHTLMLAQNKGFLLHASSAVRHGKAFLFSGVSGAGKTTLVRLAPADAQVLTDEISYVRMLEQGYTAFGTPFAGDLGRPGTNTSAPISALYFLEKAPVNGLEPVPAAEAVRLLMRNILFFTQDSDLVDLVFQTACALVNEVPCWRLSFYPDRRVWDLIGVNVNGQ